MGKNKGGGNGQVARCTSWNCGHSLDANGHCGVSACGNCWNGCPRHEGTGGPRGR